MKISLFRFCVTEFVLFSGSASEGWGIWNSILYFFSACCRSLNYHKHIRIKIAFLVNFQLGAQILKMY